MKRLLIILMVISDVLIFSCKNKTQEQLNQKNQKSQELANITRERDSILQQLYSTIDEFEKNLGIISENKGEIGQSFQERIKEDIDHLTFLLKENERKQDSLQRIVGSSRDRNRGLIQRIDTLTRELAQREERINNQNEQIGRINNRIIRQDSIISGLTNIGANQAAKLNQMVTRLNTAYYIEGKTKELMEKNVIVKDGGFLGLFGRVERLNPKFNPQLFSRVNIMNDTLIPLHSDKNKINIITIHPPDSYHLKNVNENVTQLEITDPDKFWEASKFLVVAND